MTLKDITLIKYEYSPSILRINLEGDYQTLEQLAYQIHTLINNLNKQENGSIEKESSK